MGKQSLINGEVEPGISIRNGPVTENDIPMKDVDATANGTKRKVRDSTGISSYAEAESSDDDMPLVRSSRPSHLSLKASLADDT